MRAPKKGVCLTGKESSFLWMTSFFIFYFTPILVSSVAVPIVLAIAIFYYGSHNGYLINNNAIIFFKNKTASVTILHTNIRRTWRFKNLCVLFLMDEYRVFVYFFSKSDIDKICRLSKGKDLIHSK